MAVSMAVFTFLFFVTLDYWLHYRRGRKPAATTAPAPIAVPQPAVAPPAPVWVAGFQLPDGLRFHQGHTWARPLSADTVAIGMDDFARRLTGPTDRLEVPEVGAELRQGAEAFRVGTGERATELVAPVDGTVLEVNPELLKDPALATTDPYGRGWICTVRNSQLKSNLRNLLSGRMAQRWIEDAREQLELRLMALTGTVLQDGGTPAPDFAEHLDDADWLCLTKSFFLTEEPVA